jgi:hypothetical protein
VSLLPPSIAREDTFPERAGISSLFPASPPSAAVEVVSVGQEGSLVAIVAGAGDVIVVEGEVMEGGTGGLGGAGEEIDEEDDGTELAAAFEGGAGSGGPPFNFA